MRPLLDDGTVEEELYWESRENRGRDFDVHPATPTGACHHKATVEVTGGAFDSALAEVNESQHPIEGA